MNDTPADPTITDEIRTEIHRRLKDGLDGYRWLMEKLAPVISPTEAQNARAHALRSIVVLAVSVALLVITRMVADALPYTGDSWQAAALVWFIPALLVVLTGGMYAVPFAGRILVPASLVFADSRVFFGNDLSRVDVDFAVVLRIVAGVGLFLAGGLLDYGLSSNPHRSHPLLRRLTLATLALFIPFSDGLSLAGFRLEVTGSTWVKLATGLLFLAWCWPLAQWSGRRQWYLTADVRLVFDVGLIRWCRHLLGRTYAVVTIAFIALTLINSTDLSSVHQAMRQDAGAFKFGRTLPGGQAEETMIFVPHLNRALRDADIAAGGIYAVPFSDRQAQTAISSRLQKGLTTEFARMRLASIRDLQAGFAAYQVKSPAQLRELLSPNLPITLYHIYPLPANEAPPDDRTWAVVSVNVTSSLVSATQSEFFASRTRHYLFLSMPMVTLIFAYLILLRRGGDLALARSLGLWTASLGIILCIPLLGFAMFDVHRRLVFSEGSINRAIFFGVYGYGIILLGAYLTGWLTWSVYLHARRYLLPTPYAMPLRTYWGTFLGFWAVSILLVWAAMRDLALAAIVGSFVNFFVSHVLICFMEARLRRRERAAGLTPPELRQVRSILFRLLVAPGFVLLWAVQPYMASGNVRYLIYLLAAVYLFVALFVFLPQLMKSRILGVGDNRDLAYIFTGLILPALFELTNNALSQNIAAIGLFDAAGAPLVSAFVVILLLQPVQAVILKISNYIANPALQDIQSVAGKALEACARNPECRLQKDQFVPLLEKAGIREFAYYRRVSEHEYAVLIDLPGRAPARIAISHLLRRHLERQPDLINLNQVHWHWRYYFQQFELHRLQTTIGATYLLPIRLGSSLCGLLFFGDSDGARVFAAKEAMESINQVSLVADGNPR